MYFLKDQPTVTKDAKGNSVYTYDVVRDGETTTIVADSSTVVRKAGLYKVTFTGDKATSASATTEGQLIALAPATGASDGVVNGKVYNDNTKFFVIKDNKATEASADTIITEGKDQDQIAIIVGENNEANIAKYVFIDRDSSVAAPTAVTYTYDGGSATAIGTVLTSPAASKDIAVTATAASGTTVTSVTVKGAGSDATGSTSATYTTVAGDIPAAGATKTLTVTVVANGATGYTKTFTYTLTLSTPNP